MDEEWRQVPGSRGQYEASSLGRIRNARTKRILKPFKFWNGSLGVSLYGYLNRTYTVGQLVAMAFYPDEKGRAHHKNGIVTDNRAENIEVWYE